MLKADLSGKTAMVTGASSGFGARFARVLASTRAHVIVDARRMAPLEELVRDIHESGGHVSTYAISKTGVIQLTKQISSIIKFAEAP